MNQLVFLESIKQMPMMQLPVRSVYVPLPNKGVLISPGSCLEMDQLRTLPNVTDVVAPNLFHCTGIPQASRLFPDARRWGAPGVKKEKPKILWTDELELNHWSYQKELPMVILQGMPKVNEVIFLHPESKSLIVTDLCFNMKNVRGIGAWIILHLFGTYQKLAVSKFFMRFVDDRVAFEQSLKEVMALDFDNVIMSHGENIIGDGKVKLLFALRERGLLLGEAIATS